MTAKLSSCWASAGRARSRTTRHTAAAGSTAGGPTPSAGDGAAGSVFNINAVSGQEFAAGAGLDGAVDRHPAVADEHLGLAAGVGQAGGLEGVGQGDVLGLDGERGHGR